MELAKIFEPIETDLEHVEVGLRDAARAEFGPLAEVIETLIESGGKRIRPALVLLAGRLFPQNDEHLLRLAVSVELLHLATLIHDDFIDRSAVRRGTPTINSRWDSKATVLAGDYVLAKAARLASDVENLQVMAVFADAIMDICQGEIRQDFSDPSALDRAGYYENIYAKTASLFAACTKSAALLGGAAGEELGAMREYGRNLGMAFQIVDDVLDFTASEREFGKPVGSDLRQGVVTLPVILYSEKHPQVAVLQSSPANNGHNPQAMDDVIEQIRTSPEVAAAREEASQFAREAQAQLARFPESIFRTSLWQLADYIVARKK